MTRNLSRRSAGLLMMSAAGMTATGMAKADDVVDARHVLDEAAITVQRVRDELKDSSDMDDLLQQSKGVLIVPSYYKASFILGGAYGDGVLLVRLPDGDFGDPAFYRMTAGSIGLQLGMNSAAIVFMILTEKGLSAVINDEFKIGANVGMTLGTLGVGAEAATTTHVGKDIVAYSTSKGLFAGGAFEGAVVKPRRDWNAAVYGVGNDNPAAIVQRDQLGASTHLKDILSKSFHPAQAAPN
ncbi:MAG: lipid-binding SYLF domain-containing protein [Rhodospirillaceae bacterium]